MAGWGVEAADAKIHGGRASSPTSDDDIRWRAPPSQPTTRSSGVPPPPHDRRRARSPRLMTRSGGAPLPHSHRRHPVARPLPHGRRRHTTPRPLTHGCDGIWRLLPLPTWYPVVPRGDPVVRRAWRGTRRRDSPTGDLGFPFFCFLQFFPVSYICHTTNLCRECCFKLTAKPPLPAELWRERNAGGYSRQSLCCEWTVLCCEEPAVANMAPFVICSS
jgi:hypothetical protein